MSVVKRALVVGGVSWNRIVHLDRLPDPTPHTVFARRSFDTLGGTGAGKAWNLASLGWDVELVAAIGDDDAGARALAALDRVGVRVDELYDPGGTEQHTNLMDAQGGRVSIYTNPSSPSVRVDVDALVEKAASADLVCVNILEYCRPLLAPLRAADVAFWVDLHDDDGRNPYHRDFAAAASSIQVASDRLPDWRAFAERRVADGAGVVVVTHGAAGADAFDGAAWVHIDAVPVSVIDTNGAGDAFFAGFVDTRHRGADLEAALAAGAARAALVVTCDGLGPD